MTGGTSAIELSQTTNDYVATVAKAALSAIPFAGSLLAEIAGNIIPNQRIDRIAKFAEFLDSRLSILEESFIQAQLQNENFSDLMEEGLRQAARSLSDERREYIATLITNSLSSEEVEYVESKHLLELLGELNDLEVIWLRSYLNPVMGRDRNFREKHENVLSPVIATMSSEKGVVDKRTLQDSYKGHLCRLGLLKETYKTDRNGAPQFEKSGRPKFHGYEITNLGRLLLQHIGFYREDCE